MRILLPKDHEISVLLPNYNTNNYQTTLVTSKQKKIFLRTKLQTVIYHLAARNSLDLRCMRANSATLTAAAQLQPLPFSPELLLVPLKMHKPNFSGDSTVGYVNFHHIDSLRANKTTTSLLLCNGISVDILWQEHTVRAHLQKAALAALVQERRADKLADRMLWRLLRSAARNY